MRSPRTATKSGPCSPQLERARAQQRRPNAAKKKKKKKGPKPSAKSHLALPSSRGGDSLTEKMRVSGELRSGTSNSAGGREFSVNELSVYITQGFFKQKHPSHKVVC